VFSWIATIANGRLQFTVPSLFVLGFIFLFTLGGLTGVMVAMVPFDWQVHDTYFVVAHFHYVLIGGMVFPMFAALYYWTPMLSEPLSERSGKWAFWLMFIGFNVTFLPMHLTGLVGMPRRVHTYPEALNWAGLNLVSTVGAFVFAVGVLVVLVDMALRFRPSLSGGAGNIWKAGTLEWLSNDAYVPRSIPRVETREPLWSRPTLAKEAEEGRWYLPNAPTGRRETIATTPVEAEPMAVLRLPGPGFAHLVAAAGTAGFFLLLTVKMIALAFLCGAAAVLAILIWMWESDPKPTAPVDIGGGTRLPTYLSGSRSHSWMATVVLLCAAASLYLAYVFSYLYLWTAAPNAWAGATATRVDVARPLLSAGLLISVAVLIQRARRQLAMGASGYALALHWGLAAAASFVALAMEVYAHWDAGLRPDSSGYGAMVYMASVLQGQIVIAFVIMALFTAAKHIAGRIDGDRRATFDNVALFGRYLVGQGLFGLLLIHGFPRLVQ
jgi:cytochrome c oxidase subunit I+III